MMRVIYYFNLLMKFNHILIWGQEDTCQVRRVYFIFYENKKGLVRFGDDSTIGYEGQRSMEFQFRRFQTYCDEHGI